MLNTIPVPNEAIIKPNELSVKPRSTVKNVCPMKAEDATKDNLINKILIEKKNKALENQRMAISVTEQEILSLFGDSDSQVN